MNDEKQEEIFLLCQYLWRRNTNRRGGLKSRLIRHGDMGLIYRYLRASRLSTREKPVGTFLYDLPPDLLFVLHGRKDPFRGHGNLGHAHTDGIMDGVSDSGGNGHDRRLTHAFSSKGTKRGRYLHQHSGNVWHILAMG